MSTLDPHGNWDGLISKSDAVRRNDGPGGHLPIRLSNETLELKEVREIGGLYGIGLKIDLDPPHLVQRVSNLKDPDDRSINDKVRQGDALLHIDGLHVELGSMEALERAILGPKDSTLKLTFVKMPSLGMPAGNSKDVYDVVVKRHVTIREWDETHSWLEVRDDIRGAPLQADTEIVSVMEDVRRCVVDRSNFALDFIREERVAMCSLGMHFAQDMSSDSRDRNLRPNQIQILVPGGPAHISGKLKRGDEIVGVDGVAVDASTVLKLLRGTDIIGSKCRITAKRSGSTFDVELSRTSAFSVRNMDHFVNLVDILERQLKQRASHESMLPSVKAVLAHAIETERTRCSSEALLASRLFHVQSKINGLVNDMQGMLHPGDGGSNDEFLRFKAMVEALEMKLQKACTERDDWKNKLHAMHEQKLQLESSSSQRAQNVERLEKQLQGMVPSTERAALNDQIALLNSEISQLRKAQQGMVLKENLDTALDQANMSASEATRLKSALHTMIPRRDLELAQSDVMALESEVRNLKSKLNASVLRTEYNALRQEGDEMRSEITVLKAQLKDMIAKVEFDANMSDLADARSALQRLNDAVKGMVPKEDVDQALQQSKLGWEKASLLGDELSKAKEAVEDLEAKLSQRVPRNELNAALAECQVRQLDCQRLQDENEALRKEIADVRVKLKETEQLKQVLGDKVDIMCDRADLHTAKSEVSGLEANLEAVRMELASNQTQLAQLKTQLQDKKDEAHSLRSQMADMVPRKDLALAKGLAHSVQMESTSKDKDITALRERDKKQSEVAQGLRVSLEEMRAKMAEMVPRARQLSSQAEAKAAKEEVELKTKELAALEGMLAKARCDYQALHVEMDDVRNQMSDMVARSLLAAAKAEAKIARDESDAKDVEMLALKSYNTDLKDQTTILRGEIDDLTAQLAVTAPKAQLLAAQEEERTMKSVAEAQAKEIDRLEKLVASLRADKSACLEELSALKMSFGDTVPRVLLVTSQAETRDQTDKAGELEAEVQALQASNTELKKLLTGLKEEIEAWKEKVLHMVPRPELMSAKNDARAANEVAADVQGQLQAALVDSRKFKELFHVQKQDASVLKEAMADMVTRREHLAVTSDCKKLRDQSEALQRDKTALAKALEQVQTDNKALVREVQDLKQSLACTASKEELSEAKANARKISYENDTLRSVQEALETQIKSLKGRLAKSVNRDELEIEQTESAKVMQELRALRQQLHDAGLSESVVLSGLLNALSESPAVSPVHATELQLAVRSLQRGGIEEAVELIKALAAHSPPTSPGDLVRLLATMRGPPQRSINDVSRVLSAMGQDWSVEDTELLMHECESLDHLREILEANRSFETMLMQEKQKRKEIQEELQTLMDRMVPAVPKLEPSGLGITFSGHVAITITGECCTDTIYCTLDGSVPSKANYQATGPSPYTLSLSEYATVRAVSSNKMGLMSQVKSETYKVDKSVAGPMAGVGLLIEQEEGSDDVVVTRVTAGGAAAEEGTIEVGDKLVTVDGRPVAGMHMPYIFKIVAGPAGSFVALGMRRTGGHDVSPSSKMLREYVVTLQRTVAHTQSDQASPALSKAPHVSVKPSPHSLVQKAPS